MTKKGKDKDNNIPSTQPLYTLSVASGLSGIPVHSIKQYILKGLILPYTKESGRHLFSEVDILRLKAIRAMLEDKGLNVAGIKSVLAMIPCWAVRQCSVENRNECDAFCSSEYPCWEASNKGKECINEDCRECDVYSLLGADHDVKALLRKMVR